MSRGLGCLQKAILKIAHDRYKQNPLAYVNIREILIKHYRFPTNEKPATRDNGVVFDRKAIGFRHYMSASVTVVQCFNRLVAKGLVERWPGYGIRLTRAGIKQARVIQSQL